MSTQDLVIGFDADDTLWHNETIFENVHERYRALLSNYHPGEIVDRTLFATEMKNLELYGYGVKGFTLSAIETAIQLTEGRISGSEIQQLIELGREMLAHPVELLAGVKETVAALAAHHRLLLITKGDLRDQQRKLRLSGLSSHFRGVEIVSEKDVETYREILDRQGVSPARFVMIGNSLKSDILPVIELGGTGIYIPYHLTWAAERVEAAPADTGRFHRADSIQQVSALLRQL